MAEAIVSAVAESIVAMVEEQFRNEVNLVRNVKREVFKLSEELTRLRIVLNDAENRRFKDKNINYWLSRLEQTSYEMEDVLDEWNYALRRYKMDQFNDVVLAPLKQKVCSLVPSPSCLCFKKVVVRHDIAKKIMNVKERLDQILKEKDQYNFITSQTTENPSPEPLRVQSTSLIDMGKVHGRENDKVIIVGKLMGIGGGQNESGNLQVVSIVGVGGLGKTTLAQLVYNDSRVKKCFELIIWICVSNPFDLFAIAKGILGKLGKGGCSDTNQLDVLFNHVQDSISGKKFLLVLDDVWTEDYENFEILENTLRCGRVGSKILVTTRNESVAQIMHAMYIHRLGLLSDEDCWLILRRVALFEKTNEVIATYEDIGRKIAEKCKGLPLAAKIMGRLLCSKNTLEEWKNVLNSEIWEMEEVEVNLSPHLLLSYNELSPALKRCFSYCAVFPKDTNIDVYELIRSWMALGYLGSEGDMEDKGRKYFDILAMHSLFQDFDKDAGSERIKECKMHDVVHDFAQFLRRKSRPEGTTMSKTTCQTCNPESVSTVNEFCSLFWEHKGPPPNLCDCLTRLRVLSLPSAGLQNIPTRLENLIHLRSLNLNENALLVQELKIIFQLYNLQTLSLRGCSLEEIPKDIENLIHLRHLNLSWNTPLKELPREIGSLTHLNHLDLSWNKSLEELPREIGNLIELRHLDLSENVSLKELPENICALNLRTLDVDGCSNLSRLPDGVGQLTSFRTLGNFREGSGGNKLRSLKELNNVSGSLTLTIILKKGTSSKELVEDAKEAQLRKKILIETLDIYFWDEMDENEESSMVRMNVLEALEPHRKLKYLGIHGYKGSQLGTWWLVSPHNQLTKLDLSYHTHLISLPPLGKLPCLEELYVSRMGALQIVGREFLGIERDLDFVAFPTLKKLSFHRCRKWKEWEDITSEEEEECASMTLIMPCLTHLTIQFCQSLTVLPHRLLRNLPLLQVLNISKSEVCHQLRSLKELNNVSGSLTLTIILKKGTSSKELVEDAKEAQLRKKILIETLDIYFWDEMDENEESSMMRMNLLEALEPHRKLKYLGIHGYKGSQLGTWWLVSPHNQLTKLDLFYHTHLKSLPPLGKLPCLEELYVSRMGALQIVGREFLGIERDLDFVAFPTLKKLSFHRCRKWKEWEDITSEEEEECASMALIMPCLTHLTIQFCQSLKALPHRLLRNLPLLQVLNISKSELLKDGSDWKSISEYNPHLQVKL